MSKVTASPDFDRVKPEELPRYVAIFSDQLLQVINGRLDFQNNFDCRKVSITFGASNTDTTVSHSLGRIPSGYVVEGLSASLVVYDGSIASTPSALTLRGSATGTARLLIY